MISFGAIVGGLFFYFLFLFLYRLVWLFIGAVIIRGIKKNIEGKAEELKNTISKANRKEGE